MDDKDQVQKRKRESLPHEANAPNHEESDYEGNLLVSSGKMGDGVGETQAGKTEQIKVYRRSRFKRDLTKGGNIYSSATYDVHGLTENNIELQDEPGIQKFLGENISGSSELVKRELKEDDFGSAQVEETQAGKTEHIKVYRRSRFKRDLTKGRNIYSSVSYEFTENNIELQDESGVHKKLLGENVSELSEQVKRELKEDDFGSAESLQQEEIARKESAGTIVPQDDVCPIFPSQYEEVQDISERAKLPRTMEAWSEEELDALWIGVRRYGPGNWLAMLTDPMLKNLELRTSDALSERWKIERERIIYLENFQQVMVSAGANLQEARPSGTVKIQTPQTSLVQSPDGTEINEFHSECVSSNTAFSVFPCNSENPMDATSRAKENQLHGHCNAGTEIGTTDYFSDTESDLSLKDWYVEKEVSSEGTISD